MPHELNNINYNYISDGIYIGNSQCCQTHFDENLKNKEGITVDISLQKENVDAPFGVDFYLWMPIEDNMPPTMEQFEVCIYSIEKFISFNKKIYIHCKNGHGRAPTMVAAFLIKNKNMDANEAIEFLKDRRQTIHLAGAQIQALNIYKDNLDLDR